MQFTTLALLTFSAVALAAPKFEAFTAHGCLGDPIAVKSRRGLGNGVTCVNLEQAGTSFSADTDGCVFEGFTEAGCKGTEVLLEQGSCDAKVKPFLSVRVGCS